MNYRYYNPNYIISGENVRNPYFGKKMTKILILLHNKFPLMLAFYFR